MKPLEISRRRMASSRLTGGAFETPEEAVGWHLAMQAQEYGPAKWSMGQRSTGLVDEDVDEAVAAGSIVRTHVLRATWHFVARDDIRWLLSISGPRVQQGNAGRYRDLGLDERTRARCEKVIVSALQGGERLTRNEIGAVLEDAGIDRSGQRMAYILMHCELEALIGSGGLSGKQQTYALLDERVPKGRRFDRDDAMVELVRRYLRSHGPATVKDMNWWSGFTMADIRKALELLGDEVRSETVDGIVFWSVAADEAPPPPARGAHLLQTYDELVVGFSESRFFRDPQLERASAAWSGASGAPVPTGGILLNGRIGGHWKRTIQRTGIDVEMHLYEDPKRASAKALEAAAQDLGRFFGREVALETKLL